MLNKFMFVVVLLFGIFSLAFSKNNTKLYTATMLSEEGDKVISLKETNYKNYSSEVETVFHKKAQSVGGSFATGCLLKEIMKKRGFKFLNFIEKDGSPIDSFNKYVRFTNDQSKADTQTNKFINDQFFNDICSKMKLKIH